LFSNYGSKYCGVKLQSLAQPNQGGGMVSSWNRLFGVSASAPAASASAPALAPSTSASVSPMGPELQTYLDSDPVS
jgi:hypothetical protein